MAENVKYKVFQCPCCGAPIKVKGDPSKILCLYCDNEVVPVKTGNATRENTTAATASGSVDGIKSGSTALAYLEMVFESYDWELFARDSRLGIPMVEKILAQLKIIAADDPNLWLADFEARYEPFVRKYQGVEKLLNAAVEEYKVDDISYFDTFDVYRRVSAVINSGKESVVKQLSASMARAKKYGASAEKLAELSQKLENVTQHAALPQYRKLEDTPQIREYQGFLDREIAARLAKKGIDVDTELAKADQLYRDGNAALAMDTLRLLEGHGKAKQMIKQIDKYYLIGDAVEICGKWYYFAKNSAGEDETLSLYPTQNGKVEKKALVNDILKIITNYADKLYYLNGEGRLCCCELSNGTVTVVNKYKCSPKEIYHHGRYVLLRSICKDGEKTNRCMAQLDTATGETTVLIPKLSKVVELVQDYLVYDVAVSGEDYEYESEEKKVYERYILDLDSKKVTQVEKGAKLAAFFSSGKVIYTKQQPDQYNLGLYAKSLKDDTPAVCLEKNIYKFYSVLGGKMFFLVGNAEVNTLISMKEDGTERREMPLRISDVLLLRGDWVYFIRRSGYNAALCRARTDGSGYEIIGRELYEYVGERNGYLHYINDDGELVKTRMDGSEEIVMCDWVEDLVDYNDERVLYVGNDDHVIRDEEGLQRKKISSLYAVDLTGSGKRKLVYDIKKAALYDENSVCFVKKFRAAKDGETLSKLCRVNTLDGSIEKLLDLEEEKKKMAASTIVLIIAAVLALFAFIMIFSGASGFGVFLLFGVIIAGVIGLLLKLKESDKNAEDKDTE